MKSLKHHYMCGRFPQRLLETNTSFALSNLRITSFEMSSNNHYRIAEIRQRFNLEALHSVLSQDCMNPDAADSMYNTSQLNDAHVVISSFSLTWTDTVWSHISGFNTNIPYSKRVSDTAGAAGENDTRRSDSIFRSSKQSGRVKHVGEEMSAL